MHVTPVLILLAFFAFPGAEASESTLNPVHKEKPAAGGTAGRNAHPVRNPESDSAFARAAIWESGAAEILDYSVKRGSEDMEKNGSSGRLITERRYLFPDGSAGREPAGKNGVEVLNAVLTSSWKESGMAYSRNTAVKLPRGGPFGLLRQDESFQSPSGTVHRVLDCGVTPPRLRALSGGIEAPADSALGQWPLHTEEMLFTYVRSLPKRAGYREELWILDGGVRAGTAPRVRFATLTVRGKMAGIREVDTWHVTLDREGGGRSEFWMSQSGMHPVVLAVLADGSEWTLLEISRKKIPIR